jgi:thiamine phosphate synthase YjbQ (UPF0047 family)
MITQKEIALPARNCGFHLVTSEIITRIPELKTIQHGLLHIFMKYLSASLTLNENADPTHPHGL